MYHPNKRNLIPLEALKKNADVFIEPLEIAVWKMKAHPYREAPSGLWLISYELRMIALNLLVKARKISVGEAEFYFDFCWYFNLERDDLLNQAYPLEYRRNLLTITCDEHRDKINSNFNLTPPSIEALETYDVKHRSKFAQVAKRVYFGFANTFARIDGAISRSEEIELNKLKNVLYASNSQKKSNHYERKPNHPPPPPKQRASRLNEAIIFAHQVLEIKIGATRQEIIEAYKNQVKNYHPDRALQTTPKIAQLAEEKMKEINLAYQTLKNYKFV